MAMLDSKMPTKVLLDLNPVIFFTVSLVTSLFRRILKINSYRCYAPDTPERSLNTFLVKLVFETGKGFDNPISGSFSF